MAKILYGHTFATEDACRNEFVKNIFATPIEQVESFLESHKNNFCGWKSLLEGNSKISADSFMLTVDDGYATTYNMLLPILERHNIPCVVFITTGFIDGYIPYEQQLAMFVANCNKIKIPNSLGYNEFETNDFKSKLTFYHSLRAPLTHKTAQRREHFLQKLFALNDYITPDTPSLPYLTWQQIRSLHDHPLISIGAHTVKHPSLRTLRTYSDYSEIRDSKSRLEKELNSPIELFAYPYGGNNWLSRKHVKMAKYKYAFTTQEKPVIVSNEIEPYKIPRYDLHSIIK
jgi:peptidoglycan/xylan/chitin deacetylase (PgdA/CDA1 family)